jgi:hypothetical protein
MSKPTLSTCLFVLIFGINSVSTKGKKPPIFTAKFYDEKGVYLGGFGELNDNSQIYVASCEILFPDKFSVGDVKMTPQEIIFKVGTEINYDRFPAIVELNTHVGICKLPPKKHRDEIREIIEKTHLDAQNSRKLDSIDYEIGGCGYHNNAGELLHLRAQNGKASAFDRYPSIEIFNAIDFYTKVDSSHQLISEGGAKLIEERRVQYTWHTHPPKINPLQFQQAPSYHDYLFGNNYQYIKQHFLISLKYKSVHYYGYGTELTNRTGVSMDNFKAFNFKMSYDTFFALQ